MKLSMIFSLLLSLSLFTSCGKKSKLLTGVDVGTVSQDDSVFLSAEFKLELGENKLPGYSYEIPGYGTLSSEFRDDENYLTLALNLTEVLKLPEGGATLPNGHALPIDFEGGIIEIPVKGINGKVYIAYSGGTAMVGLAVGIKQLDGLDLGELGVFRFFKIKGTQVGAGIYTSGNTGETGISAFVFLGGDWSPGFISESFNVRNYVIKQEYIKRRTKKKLARKLRRQMRKDMLLEFSN